ncbi:hypothetical protein [Nitrosomonas communis]|uniref:Uncharacterized protein n=1 Tax=Nitrosomonas communis TaxID=44574 RepID=A0A1I4X7V3_9PROT|nr:hypothetical protein [Nitrosomonas communis]SFN21623.1 hypothetical protein SAMN05421863_11392 [Nitrosomonas communis]
MKEIDLPIRIVILRFGLLLIVLSPISSQVYAEWSTQSWDGGLRPESVRNQCLAGDFNGDGWGDIACYTLRGGEWHLGLTPGPAGFKSARWWGGLAPASVANQCLAGRFNKDNSTDIACHTLNQSDQWLVGFSQPSHSKWESEYWWGGPGPESAGNQCLAGDFDGDGLTDIACYTLQGGVAPWTGTGNRNKRMVY